MLAVFLIGSFRVVPLLFACYKIKHKLTEENLFVKLLDRGAMELIVITTLCIGLFILLNPCASLQIQLQPWLGQVQDDLISLRLRDAYDLQQHAFSKMLPRKLRFIQFSSFSGEHVMKKDGEKDYTPQHHKQKGDLSGKGDDRKEPGRRHGRGGTMKEWMDMGADNMSQFFTMDYSHVRRRRPIHNKSLPVGP